MKRIWKILKRYFVSGILVVVPIIITYLVLRLLFETIDGILQPLLLHIFGFYVAGMGLLATLLVVFLTGLLTRNFVGAQVYKIGDWLLARVPVIRPIYTASKQLLEAVTMPNMNSFKEVVMIEYPRQGCYSLGFLSNRVRAQIDNKEQSLMSVFVPSTPTPISGMVVLFPSEQVSVLDMTVEEGVKFIVSGGVVSPELLRPRQLSSAPGK